MDKCEICKVDKGDHMTGCPNGETGDFSGTLDSLVGFLEEYECLCRKYGMKASAYGSEVYAERIERVDWDEITEHIASLKDEGLKPNRVIDKKRTGYWVLRW